MRRDHQMKRPKKLSMKRFETFFEHYKDPVENAIMVEGVEKFCVDLCVDPTDVVLLVFAWHCRAERMCIFTYEEFQRGCIELDADSLESLKSLLDSMREELLNQTKFRAIYEFSFFFGKDPTQKSIDMAIALWNLLLANRFPLLKDWNHFLQTFHKKPISKDTWNLFLEFTFLTKNPQDLSNYNPDDAWPVIIDEFVDYIRKRDEVK